MLLSFQMLPEQPAPELLDALALADGLGYFGCYSADEIYHKDAWLLFAAAAQRTERIRLGPCVAPIYMREPTYIAQLAATLRVSTTASGVSSSARPTSPAAKASITGASSSRESPWRSSRLAGIEGM